MKKIILTVVRHRGGGFHLGVNEEHRGTARFLANVQVIVRAYDGLPGQYCHSFRCLYKHKSIHSEELRSWLSDKRETNETLIPLFIAKLEQTETEDVYTIIGMAPYKKVCRRPIFVDQEGNEYHYTREEVFSVLFEGL